ncbi:hypothetical protein H6G27_04690 [Nostoc linckia FACHB-104]|nr:hypothetical protein [Nostoc linckia FACHB-104]
MASLPEIKNCVQLLRHYGICCNSSLQQANHRVSHSRIGHSDRLHYFVVIVLKDTLGPNPHISQISCA